MKRFICLLLATMLCLSTLTVPAGAVAGSDAISITTGWYWPLPANNKSISSGFGVKRSTNLHQGIDIRATSDTPIYAARAGVVYKVGKDDRYLGNYVCIRHGTNGGKYIFTTYMHMTRYTVKENAVVDQNTVIGYVGSTGDSTGPHLHFQIFRSPSMTPKKNDGSKNVNPSHNNATELKINYEDPSPSAIHYSYTRGSSTQNTNTPAKQPTKQPTNTSAASTLKISMNSYPGTLQRGSSYGLRGTISSNYNIKSVSGSVINSSGRTVLSSSDSPNAKSMNVQNSNLNRKLTFNTLAAGTYTLKVEATDTSGKKTSWSTSFRVRTSDLSVNMTSSPTSIKYKSAFGLRGTIKSNEKITSVKGFVLNASGKTVLSSSDFPNAKSMDVRTANLNNKLAFNKLAKGSYTLKIVATDASGNSVTWSQAFRVY